VLAALDTTHILHLVVLIFSLLSAFASLLSILFLLTRQLALPLILNLLFCHLLWLVFEVLLLLLTDAGNMLIIIIWIPERSRF
jgi:hypothetical protein